jgi:hypothetical protein
LTLNGFFVSLSILRFTDQDRAEAVAGEYAASWENVSIRASDGIVLRDWLFTPQNPQGRAVLLVHAVLGNRHDMLGRRNSCWTEDIRVFLLTNEAAAHPVGRFRGVSTSREILQGG